MSADPVRYLYAWECLAGDMRRYEKRTDKKYFLSRYAAECLIFGREKFMAYSLDGWTVVVFFFFHL